MALTSGRFKEVHSSCLRPARAAKEWSDYSPLLPACMASHAFLQGWLDQGGDRNGARQEHRGQEGRRPAEGRQARPGSHLQTSIFSVCIPPGGPWDPWSLGGMLPPSVGFAP